MEDHSSEDHSSMSQTLSTQENVACVKARLQEEGREARNLIAYSLPLQSRKTNTDKQSKAPAPKESKKLSVETRRFKQDKRHRSASAGRDPQASLRARHWGFLFRNLQQAVDEIYQTSEDDESIIECKEAILMLERYTNDFYKLIDWLKIKWEYENTSPPQRPNSLAWEIRTSSPGKALKSEKKTFSMLEARKALNFENFPSNVTAYAKYKSRSPPVLLAEGSHQQKSTSKKEAKASSFSISPSKLTTAPSDPFIKDLTKSGKPFSAALVDEGIKKSASGKSVLDSISESPHSSFVPKEGIINHSSLAAASASPANTHSSSSTSPTCSSSVVPANAPAALQISTSNSGLYAAKLKDANKAGTGVRISKKKEIDIGGKAESLRNEQTHSFAKQETKNLGKEEAKSHVKEEIPKRLNQETKNLSNEEISKSLSRDDAKSEVDSKRAQEIHQPKNNHPKPGPLVNMNKASQVRKAFNQSRTPVKIQPGSVWRNNYAPQSEHKNSCVKQQGSGGRLAVRRLTEGKQTQSPPLSRRNPDGKLSGQRGAPGAGTPRGMLERSYTSYPMTKPLIRSSTSLDGQSYSKGFQTKHSESGERSSSDGRCPSNASLASSTNTSSSGQSWADKVKGNKAGRNNSLSQISLQDEDEDGWEVVRRHRRSHGGSVASLNSQGLLSARNSHPRLQKKGSAPFRMQTRFEQPSSTVSMPSLIPASDETDLASPRDHLGAGRKGGRSSSQKNGVSPKASKSDSRKASEKKKPKGSKENPGSSRNSPRAIKESSQVIGTQGQPKPISNCDKYRKDVANTRTQNEIKLATRSTPAKDPGMGSAESPPCPAKTSGSPTDDTSRVMSGSNEFVEANGAEETTGEFRPDHGVALEMEVASGASPCSGADGNRQEDFLDEVKARIEGEANSFEEGDSDNESEREEEKMRCNAQAFECAIEEEKRLKQQIEEAEKAAFEVCDVIDEEEVGPDAQSPPPRETFYQYDPSFSKLASLTWADEMDAIENMDDIRTPGRVLHIHEKLSSPSRKLPISEKLRRHKEKLAKAQELRGKLILAKTEKLKDLFRKIDEVNVDKERLLMEKRDLFERKMDRAEEKRRCHLQLIVNKAHDEENKAKEIAFINGLEAQNKLHDIMQQHQSHESRLADMAEERYRKQEEKAAKEVAALERRKALEAERQARLVELCEKRRKRCERIDRQLAERREELLEQAREKARDREERLSALQQAQLAKESELVKKIQQKQEETARRHEENIEQIRQKALESSILKYSRGSDEAPKLRRYETKKLCTLCTTVIPSEVYLLSHLRSRLHQEGLKALHKRDVSQEESETYNLKFIINAPPNIDDPHAIRDKERQKAFKKRCRKIRTRMTARGKEFLANYSADAVRETPFKTRMSKSLTQVGKLLSNQGSGPWPPADVALLDRHLLELIRVLEKGSAEEQRAFAFLDGFRRLFALMSLIVAGGEDAHCVVPARSLAFCAKAMLAACKSSVDNCHFLLFSNLCGTIVDLLMRRLNDMSADMARNGSSNSLNTIASLPSDPVAAALMELLAQILQDVADPNLTEIEGEKTDDSWPRLQDVVSYCVSMGVADKISWYFNHVQNPVENDRPCAEIILAAMSLLSALAKKLSGRSPPDDPTQLIGTFHVTDACGVVSLLYGLLLHQGGRSPSPPADSLLSPSTLAISAAATTLLHNLAELDLTMFQSVLGSEGISLEFRHIASFLLWFCSHWPCQEVLHNVIALVGFFAVNNKENQSMIQSGETPSVLQQLCSLPWQYFSEPRLTHVLFPTLLACCLSNEDNLTILQQEMSFQVLEDYLDSEKASTKPLLQCLQK